MEKYQLPPRLREPSQQSKTTTEPERQETLREEVSSFELSIRKYWEKQVLLHKAGRIKLHYMQWCSLTSDMEVIETVTGMPIDILGNLDNARRTSFQYPFGKEEHNFVKVEIERLLRKGVIVFSQHEVGELISPIFVRPKDEPD